MVPINVSEEKMDLLSRTFGFSKGSLPFTYLGLPLRLSKPKVKEFLPLVNRCERRLVSTSSFLSQAGRLELATRLSHLFWLSSWALFLCHFPLLTRLISTWNTIYGLEDVRQIQGSLQKLHGLWCAKQKKKRRWSWSSKSKNSKWSTASKKTYINSRTGRHPLG